MVRMKLFTQKVAFIILMVISYGIGRDLDVLKQILVDNDLNGSIVVKKIGGADVFTNDIKSSMVQYSPASTFKIFNTLIAIDGGYVGENELFKWNGEIRAVPAWNHDQTMSTAFKSSCVWVYEQIEKRVGIQQYAGYFKKIKYGNSGLSVIDTSFWLTGELRISALEQVEFLEGIVSRRFPLKKESYEYLRSVMEESKTDEYVLFGKSGWIRDMGWYVGYLEKDGETWVFAVRLDNMPQKPERLKLRKDIALLALKTLDVLEH